MESSHFSLVPAPDFFFGSSFGVKNLGSGSTLKISAPTSSGSEKQLQNFFLDSAPDFYTKNLKNLNFNKKSCKNGKTSVLDPDGSRIFRRSGSGL